MPDDLEDFSDDRSADRDELPRRHGRAARYDPPNRFEPLHVAPDPAALDPEELRQVPTTFFQDDTRSILSKNDSPDIPFTYSVNPYRGCEHGCVYCLSGDTLILMADGTTRPIALLRVGDAIYGTVRRGWYRRYERTQVLAHWSVEKSAYRVVLEDGTELVCSGDHRFLTDRGWKFVTGTGAGTGQRPHLTVSNKLMGVGGFAAAPTFDDVYRRGYLCGMIRGDGLLASYKYERAGRAHGNQFQFRLALVDTEALDRTRRFLADFDVHTYPFSFGKAVEGRRKMHAIRTHARASVERIERLIAWPVDPSTAWCKGYLAGLFDAEGSYSGGTLRISNTNAAIIGRGKAALEGLGFGAIVECLSRNRAKEILVLRLLGGLSQHLRFFHMTEPAILRKRDIEGQAVKSSARLRVVSVEPLGRTMQLFDITTGTGDFIANGVVSHNCYARPSHEYLGFSAGLDFETKIVVKASAPELLEDAFRKQRWVPQPVAFSGNTDCYQPAERRLELTRRCLEVCLRYRNPATVLTKNRLVLRDLDLLAELAARDLVAVMLSVTSLRPEVTAAMEPRTARPAARLQAVEKLAAHGIPVGVMVAPVVPGLTDEEVPAILDAAAGAGAQWAGFQIMRLPGPVKDLFVDWIRDTFPDRAAKVLARMADLRGPALDSPAFGARMTGEGIWARLITDLFKASVRRNGLSLHGPKLATHHFRRPPQGQMELF